MNGADNFALRRDELVRVEPSQNERGVGASKDEADQQDGKMAAMAPVREPQTAGASELSRPHDTDAGSRTSRSGDGTTWPPLGQRCSTVQAPPYDWGGSTTAWNRPRLGSMRSACGYAGHPSIMGEISTELRTACATGTSRSRRAAGASATTPMPAWLKYAHDDWHAEGRRRFSTRSPAERTAAGLACGSRRLRELRRRECDRAASSRVTDRSRRRRRILPPSPSPPLSG